MQMSRNSHGLQFYYRLNCGHTMIHGVLYFLPLNFSRWNLKAAWRNNKWVELSHYVLYTLDSQCSRLWHFVASVTPVGRLMLFAPPYNVKHSSYELRAYEKWLWKKSYEFSLLSKRACLKPSTRLKMERSTLSGNHIFLIAVKMYCNLNYWITGLWSLA